MMFQSYAVRMHNILSNNFSTNLKERVLPLFNILLQFHLVLFMELHVSGQLFFKFLFAILAAGLLALVQ